LKTIKHIIATLLIALFACGAQAEELNQSGIRMSYPEAYSKPVPVKNTPGQLSYSAFQGTPATGVISLVVLIAGGDLSPQAKQAMDSGDMLPLLNGTLDARLAMFGQILARSGQTLVTGPLEPRTLSGHAAARKTLKSTGSGAPAQAIFYHVAVGKKLVEFQILAAGAVRQQSIDDTVAAIEAATIDARALEALRID
jgi:hypothetical protein